MTGDAKRASELNACPAPPAGAATGEVSPSAGARRALYRQARKLVVAVIGATLILLGLVLIVLPGPFTLPFVLLGLAVLATEFVWARRLLTRVKGTAKSIGGRVSRTFGRGGTDA